MLQVSAAALTLLKEALESERTQDEYVFRLEFSDDQFVLNLDEVQADDVAFEHDGSTVLATPREVADNLLNETTIDLESTTEGPKLILVTSDA
jgi:hypothetical protein